VLYETAVHLSQAEAARERGSRDIEERVTRKVEAIIVASGLGLK